MPTQKLKTITGNTLMDLDLPPLKFIVQGFLPQGFHILAGAPKAGKSWLLLLLCLQVAKGEPFWERRTLQGDVLYLCLEDSENRIQQRLSEITEDAPPNLHFAVTANSLSDGMINQIEMFLADHPATNLIVIDTLQCIRESSDSNTYASDYRDIGALKAIADKHNIAVIGVQHLRKQHDNDPHQMVSGSTGLLGAADGSYILKKEKPVDTNAKLYIRGRDISESIFSLQFDSITREWQFLGSDTPQAEDMKSDNIMTVLIAYLKKEESFEGTATELSQRLGGICKSNVLSRKLTQYENELNEIGIEFVKTRTGSERTLTLLYTPPMTI